MMMPNWQLPLDAIVHTFDFVKTRPLFDRILCILNPGEVTAISGLKYLGRGQADPARVGQPSRARLRLMEFVLA